MKSVKIKRLNEMKTRKLNSLQVRNSLVRRSSVLSDTNYGTKLNSKAKLSATTLLIELYRSSKSRIQCGSKFLMPPSGTLRGTEVVGVHIFQMLSWDWRLLRRHEYSIAVSKDLFRHRTRPPRPPS